MRLGTSRTTIFLIISKEDSIFPDCLSLYKHYDAGLIEDVVEEVVAEDDTETENYPCANIMNHWKFLIQLNEKNIDGQMKSTAYSQPDRADTGRANGSV